MCVDTTVKNSIRNCLTVFQNDPKLEGAIRYNILTERIDIVKPLWWSKPTTTLNDTDLNYLMLYLEDQYTLTSEKKIQKAISIVADCNKYHPMNNSIEGWTLFSNPRIFAKYGRQRGWERAASSNELSATGSDLPDGFRELTEEEAQALVNKSGLSDTFFIDSAATSREEIGNPVHYGTRHKLEEVGIYCGNHKARQMQKHEYDEYDYIIGMDSWNIRNINRIIGNSDPEGKVSKLLDFTEEKGKDIADPWYTGDFDTTYRDVKKGCEALLNDCLLRF